MSLNLKILTWYDYKICLTKEITQLNKENKLEVDESNKGI
jgi:hypothetical protein